jgi:ubiquinone/menaquinone biosynthesis C-methylase UbiE
MISPFGRFVFPEILSNITQHFYIRIHMGDKNQRVQAQLGIIRDLGYILDHKSKILDLGCGNGDLVYAYREKGYKAYGCDFVFRVGFNKDQLMESGIISLIKSGIYELPYEDNSFDFVVSEQVFEHVKDYSTTLSEIKRVLKPEGFSLHFFPSRYKIIETHLFIPFASTIQNYYWLLFWAYLGVRNEYQKGISARQAAERNYKYLKNNTNYLSKSEIRGFCQMYFRKVIFSEAIFFKYIRRLPILFKLASSISFLPALYSTLYSRILFLGNK